MIRAGNRLHVSLRAVLVLSMLEAIALPAQYGTNNGEWRFWGGDAGSTRYSPLDQINKDNFSKLRVAWRWKTDNFGPRPEFNYEVTPLMVGGVLYATAGPRRDVVAIDAATGETRWMWRFDEGRRAQQSSRPNSGRGVAYWSDGSDARIVLITPGYRLVALDAETGRPVTSFGKDGMVDMYEGLDRPVPPDGAISSSSPPIVIKDVIVVGSALDGGAAPPSKANIAGHIRGYDVRTGKRLWIFHTIPVPGELGNETWENDSWSYSGNTGAWAPLAGDEELGLVYIPVESPTNDFYGGHRLGNNLFANSIVSLDARTGKRVWHFQTTHHDLWDYDLPASPVLLDLTVDGRRIKTVTQLSKQGFAYVFDRTTGQPVWPIEERPVPQSDVPGERTSPTQPFPSKPPPFGPPSPPVLFGLTPELRTEAETIAKAYKMGPMYTPPVIATDGIIGEIHPYGGNWQSGAADPETGMLYVSSITEYQLTGLRKPAPTTSDMNYDAGSYKYMHRRGSGEGGSDGAGPSTGCGAPGPRGLPLFAPPLGVITAIDLNTGTHLWVAPNGDTPDCIKNHPALKGIDIPRTGKLERAGMIVTKTLLIAGEGGGLRNPSGPMAGGPMLNAYDKKTGELVGSFKLPGNQTGIPMTYLANGRQYVVVAVGAQGQPGELVALTVQ